MYIPPAKRKSGNNSRPQRFHGAFTGGFSAGYFNTVDTKEGWKPSNQKQKDQRLEDFMDEQDHEEWGGPTKVRQDYHTIAEDSTSNVKSRASNQTESLDSLLRISHQSIGPRLLRKLGWREDGNTAFVPIGDGEAMNLKQEEDQEATMFLSSKRLKKIRLQTNRFEIPPPKLDLCGLGFEPHQDAPEFRAFQERRKKRAKERQYGGGSSDVYRASTLTKESNEHPLSGGKDDNDVDDYLNYEAAEDFVGKRSVGGFAFHDDEDDAYDNANHDGRGGKPTREKLGDEYNTEIYEHQDSDDEGTAGVVAFDPSRAQLNDRGLIQKKTDIGSVLSSWANTSDTTTKKTALMSNGKPPLEGFVLGGSIDVHKKRYPGPDIPRDYVIERHVFGENEHPLIFQTIARAVKLQEKEQQLQKMKQKSLPPLGGSHKFVNLADAMKSRFTSSKTEETQTTDRVGLYKPDPIVAKSHRVEEAAPASVPTVEKPIVLKRTVHSFLPHPLLCKRFGVPVPKNAIGISMNASTMSPNEVSRVTEANYFEKEIMSVRENERLIKKEEIEKERKSGSSKAKVDMDLEQDPEGLQRPSMEKLKSIFDPASDSESSTDLDASSDEEEEEKQEQPKEDILQRAKDIVANAIAMEGEKLPSEPAAPEKNGSDDDISMSSSSGSSSDSRRRKRRRERKSHRKHSSRRRKRSRSPDSDEEEDEDRRRRKERRRKHDRKHRKKKSSRRKRDREH